MMSNSDDLMIADSGPAMAMKPVIVAAFYQFLALPHYASLKDALLSLMIQHQVRGTIILAKEGINGTIAAERGQLDVFISTIRSWSEFENLNFKETQADSNPFSKSKVKLRKEIVSMGVDTLSTEQVGTYLEPEAWNDLLTQSEELLLIDTRNDYEVKLGTFKGALNPKTDNFRDFPAYAEKNLLSYKDKPVAMFCTGGIRCEKSTAYLKTLGFKEVYHLKGGILNYLEKISKKDSQWQGSCFVFDDRVAVDANLDPVEAGSIDKEWKNKNKKSQY